MTEWLLPASVATAALLLTYLFCLRPMRRGHRSVDTRHTSAAASDRGAGESETLDRALEQARVEVARLQAEHGRQAQPAAPAPAPPTRPSRPPR